MTYDELVDEVDTLKEDPDEDTEDTGTEISFIQESVDDALGSDEFGENLYVSGSYYWCPRKEVLRRMYDRTDEINPTLNKILSIGNAVHEHVQTMLGEQEAIEGSWYCWKCNEIVVEFGTMPETCPSCGSGRKMVEEWEDGRKLRTNPFELVETTFKSSEHDIKVRLDGVVWLPPEVTGRDTVVPAVLEIKSKSPYSITNDDLFEDHEDYRTQTQLAMHLTQESDEIPSCEHAVLYFAGKHKWTEREFLMHYDPSIPRRQFDRLQSCRIVRELPDTMSEDQLREELSNYEAACDSMNEKRFDRCEFADVCSKEPHDPFDGEEATW